MNKIVEKKWVPSPTIPPEIDHHLREYHPTLRQMLYNRGILDRDAAERFLYADNPVHDPFLFTDMNKVVELIQEAIDQKDKIVIFGDYDVDGVTATVLLFQVLERLNAIVDKYIPNRFDQGYGFSKSALSDLLKMRPDLVITVDCGVRSIEEIHIAKTSGIKVIVTDHHQPLNYVPHADAIICPKLKENHYPFSSLAGVGLAYKLAMALATYMPSIESFVEDQLDLVALGTVADMAELVDENRVLVRKGLQKIHTGKRPGLVKLAGVSGLDYKQINSEHIGFMLGPRLNAAGRMNIAEKSFCLLNTSDEHEAGLKALELDQDNRDRQRETKLIINKVEEKIEKEFEIIGERWHLLFFYDEEFNEGVNGLVASRLAEDFYCPSIIGTIKGEIIRASCRSIPGIDITEALDECADYLLQHGGHAMAAGITFKAKNEQKFIERLSQIIKEKSKIIEHVPVVNAECELKIRDLQAPLLDLMQTLEPTGMGNPTPLFISRQVEMLYPKKVGNDKGHLKFSVRSYESGNRGKGHIVIDAIAFGFGGMADGLKSGDLVDILYSFEKNKYNGKEALQIKIRDIKPHKS